MRSHRLILLALLSGLGLPACSGKHLHAGDDGAGGVHPGSGGLAGAAAGAAGSKTGAAGAAGSTAGAAGSIMPSGSGATGGPGGATGTGGAPTGQAGSSSTTGSGGTTGGGGTTGSGGAAGGGALSLNPSSATFAATLVEAVSAPQTFTVRNQGSAAAGTAAVLAPLAGTNAAHFMITSNSCGATLQPGASCDIAVAFAPKTRSGPKSASLVIGAASGMPANASLSGTALPSLGLLAGALGGAGNLDGTGAAVRFRYPGSVVSDGAGNLYVSDNNAIRKFVIATGAVTTFVGAKGQSGSVDGTGAAARFAGPGCLFYDGAGNLYVSDDEDIRRVVIATGAVTTIAGTPGQIGTTDGTGAAARFYGPACVASDGAGNLYVTDNGSSTIRRISIATGAVTTFAGSPGSFDSVDGIGAAARFAGPGAIVGDGAGNLYVADDLNRTIRKIVIATRSVTTIAGQAGPDNSVDGIGTAARFVGPGGIVLDGAGNLFVTDSDAFGGTIRKIVLASRAVTTFAGAPFKEGMLDGTGTAARFGGIGGIAQDGGNLYITDSKLYGGSIRNVDPATAAVTTLAGAGQHTGSADGTGSAARFWSPGAVTGDGAGNLFVSDSYAVRKVDTATGVVTTLPGSIYSPGAIATDGAGNVFVGGSLVIRKIVVATGAVTVLAGDPTYPYPDHVDGVGTAARFGIATGLATDGAGNLFVSDAGNSCSIRRVVIATGAVTTVTTVTDGTGAIVQFGSLRGIASDGAGNLFIAADETIRKVVIATGAVTTIAGAGVFSYPAGVASDGAGNLYVTELYNSTVRRIAVDTGAVSTVIGSTGSIGITLGALPASLNQPLGVFVLPSGELVIADTGENAILIGHL